MGEIYTKFKSTGGLVDKKCSFLYSQVLRPAVI